MPLDQDPPADTSGDPVELLLQIATVRRGEDTPVIEIDPALRKQHPLWIVPVLRRVDRLNRVLPTIAEGEHGGWVAIQHILSAMHELGVQIQVLLSSAQCEGEGTRRSLIAKLVMRAGRVSEGDTQPVHIELTESLQKEPPPCLDRFRKKLSALNEVGRQESPQSPEETNDMREFRLLLRYLRSRHQALVLTSLPSDSSPAAEI
ncbi:MAG: hypothetical protein WCS85_05980 [Candidatus Peribacteraceae bacterium]|jgi:hypothetical protein